MQKIIDYYLTKYENATYGFLSDNEPCTIVVVDGVYDYSSCLKGLGEAKLLATHLILVRSFNEDTTRAIEEFVKENDYLMYRIDGIFRIYLKNIT
jgi:hypothetical protein